ncbi:hypothetical protein OUZ56_031802 [Daphnia magna]|uniref:Uncharacterized protein n=1 Tax=Daphnia magna TaxID=35525 RepID=A0ABQ9ZV90_9CRUS|nr:hypothetical protein OUZ56_031802 [Daphnia magna]
MMSLTPGEPAICHTAKGIHFCGAVDRDCNLGIRSPMSTAINVNTKNIHNGFFSKLKAFFVPRESNELFSTQTRDGHFNNRSTHPQ